MHTTSPIAVLTGATGFIGSHLADYLLLQGYTVRCIVRQGSNLQWLKGKNVALYDVGLTDADALAPVLAGAQYVFHLAGVVRAARAADFWEGNVAATQTLLDALVQYAPPLRRLVVVSSLAVTGSAQLGQPVDENSPLQPISLYGRTKWQQEQLLQTYQHRLPITTIRPPAVYGERETDIFQFFKTYQMGLMPVAGMWGNKELSMVHVSDLVQGIYLAATQAVAVGQVYFLGSKEQYTWNDIAAATQQALGKKALTVRLPHWSIYVLGALAQGWTAVGGKASILSIEKAHEMTAAAWTCSSQKAMQQLGYRPTVALTQGIAQTIAWYSQQGWLS